MEQRIQTLLFVKMVVPAWWCSWQKEVGSEESLGCWWVPWRQKSSERPTRFFHLWVRTRQTWQRRSEHGGKIKQALGYIVLLLNFIVMSAKWWMLVINIIISYKLCYTPGRTKSWRKQWRLSRGFGTSSRLEALFLCNPRPAQGKLFPRRRTSGSLCHSGFHSWAWFGHPWTSSGSPVM